MHPTQEALARIHAARRQLAEIVAHAEPLGARARALKDTIAAKRAELYDLEEGRGDLPDNLTVKRWFAMRRERENELAALEAERASAEEAWLASAAPTQEMDREIAIRIAALFVEEAKEHYGEIEKLAARIKDRLATIQATFVHCTTPWTHEQVTLARTQLAAQLPRWNAIASLCDPHVEPSALERASKALNERAGHLRFDTEEQPAADLAAE